MNHHHVNFDFANESKVTTCISYNGFEFNYLSDRWTLNRNVTVLVDCLDSFVQPLRDDILETLVFYAETASANHTSNIAKTLNFYQKLTGENDLTEKGFASFKNKIPKKDWYRVSVLRGMIRQMRYLGLDKHIDDAVFKLTDQWSLGGNDKGVAVLTLDPETGPFSDLEFQAIGLHAAHRYAEGALRTDEYACLSMFKASGRRPVQIASIKCKDFSYSTNYTGSPTYVVLIPRAKVRGGKFRSILKPYALVNSVAQVVELHIKEQTAKVEAALGRKMTLEEKGELPLFIDVGTTVEIQSIPPDSLMDYLKSELPHIKTSNLTSKLNSAVTKLKVISERTGKPLKSTSYRFRYTLGSRAAREGAGILTIANLLDQSDTQNVKVYVANAPEHAVHISKIMNQPLARYASAFAGKLVEDEAEANTENAGAARIPCREKDCEVGSCGSSSFCQDYAPIACYLCPKFRPWAHAPHHLILEWLVEERDRLKVDANGDMQIVAINDNAILAVCQVIQLCREYNNG
ncbi:TPA: site-specific integrase [Vibrio parahaemolyticus]|uniref:site-specific integrase n=1 Tax=Vibrio TaxID=662 RepID=UPI00041D3961|nr:MULTISPECIES: site-specific integrase [Vibrio]HCE1949276.1 site-specific integrase [Vibrio parahaemolyticus]MDW2276334.1 site-specific integrase [Vibrio sp. 1074]MDW2287447.1 site-specific integrase [Vibrio sp. 1562]MDW3123959.1 site-specific integrase [Vibrio sp. 1974]HCE3178234.1 site-specific integrase [Vibrio parahaemolyticus]